MSEEKKDALVKAEGGNALVDRSFTNSGVQIRSLEEAVKFSRYVQESGLAPRGVDTPEKILIAMQCGFEVGLKPMQGIQSIAVINGRPSLWGDAVLGLCKASGQLEKFHEKFVMKKTTSKDANDGYTAVCTIRRTGDEEDTVSEFSVEDAKRAELWGNEKKDPWIKYPKRMLKYRARTFALRDKFADVLMGIPIAEEMMDAPIDITEQVEKANPKMKPTVASALDEPEALLDKAKKPEKGKKEPAKKTEKPKQEEEPPKDLEPEAKKEEKEEVVEPLAPAEKDETENKFAAVDEDDQPGLTGLDDPIE